MKTWVLPVFLLVSSVAFAQSPDAVKYAPRPILLLETGADAVMPMVFTVDGKQHLEFVPSNQIKASMDKGGLPVRLGDVLSALTQDAQTVTNLQAENNQLRTENERLWKVAMKDAPTQQQTQTVVVKQPAQHQPSPFERYALLRSLMQPIQPYQLPMPIVPAPVVNPFANRLQANCTTSTVGGTAYTTCN